MHVNINIFVVKVIIYMSKLEGMKTTCLAKRKTMREVSFMMNILRETNKIVEIKFLYNVRIVTSLCFMI
jgi:hypothetical protein